MLDLKVKGHDFSPIQNDGTTCRKCGLQTTAAVLMWGGIGLDQCTGILPLDINIDLSSLDKCECGATKAMGIGRKMTGHSSWCPWSP